MGMTLKEVAEFLGSSKQLVCNQARMGLLEREDDGTFLEESVISYKRTHPNPKPGVRGPRGPNAITKNRERLERMARERDEEQE